MYKGGRQDHPNIHNVETFYILCPDVETVLYLIVHFEGCIKSTGSPYRH